MVRNYRKPLICVAPKTLLRLPAAVSSLGEMAPGTSFQSVLNDEAAQAGQVNRVVFVFGKHFYALAKERETRGLKNVALIRIEVMIRLMLQFIEFEV